MRFGFRVLDAALQNELGGLVPGRLQGHIGQSNPRGCRQLIGCGGGGGGGVEQLRKLVPFGFRVQGLAPKPQTLNPFDEDRAYAAGSV